MKASELRIGNYILYKGEVTAVLPWHISAQYEAEEHVIAGRRPHFKADPIPLTQDAFDKLPFDFVNGDYKHEQNTMFFSGSLSDLWLGDSSVYSEFHVPKTPEYLHQLQNLYFFLTGQELTYNTEYND